MFMFAQYVLRESIITIVYSKGHMDTNTFIYHRTETSPSEVEKQ